MSQLLHLVPRTHSTSRFRPRARRRTGRLGTTLRNAGTLLAAGARHLRAGLFLVAETIAYAEILKLADNIFPEPDADPDPPDPTEDGKVDIVDQASWESFPASDPPGY